MESGVGPPALTGGAHPSPQKHPLARDSPHALSASPMRLALPQARDSPHGSVGSGSSVTSVSPMGSSPQLDARRFGLQRVSSNPHSGSSGSSAAGSPPTRHRRGASLSGAPTHDVTKEAEDA